MYVTYRGLEHALHLPGLLPRGCVCAHVSIQVSKESTRCGAHISRKHSNQIHPKQRPHTHIHTSVRFPSAFHTHAHTRTHLACAGRRRWSARPRSFGPHRSRSPRRPRPSPTQSPAPLVWEPSVARLRRCGLVLWSLCHLYGVGRVRSWAESVSHAQLGLDGSIRIDPNSAGI